VIDPLISKRQQLLLATQLCRMVLKVCTTLSPQSCMQNMSMAKYIAFCIVVYRSLSAKWARARTRELGITHKSLGCMRESRNTRRTRYLCFPPFPATGPEFGKTSVVVSCAYPEWCEYGRHFLVCVSPATLLPPTSRGAKVSNTSHSSY
jgi:hypothetical protein